MNLKAMFTEADELLNQHPTWIVSFPCNPFKLFEVSGDWMRQVLMDMRRTPLPKRKVNWTFLGCLKYALAGGVALIVFVLAMTLHVYWLAVLAIPIFYLVEVQMLFLFPVAIDGSTKPFMDSVSWTAKAGNLWCVVFTVIRIAAVMMFGGLMKGEYVRHWALGCLVVLLWYETLRNGEHHAT